VKRNKSGAVNELLQLQDYFKRRKENYKLVHAIYGSPTKALMKTIDYYLDKKFIAHPYKALYEIIDKFIEHKEIKSLEVADLALWNDITRTVKGLRIMAGKLMGVDTSGKKNEAG
jgi:hypothetical protein